MCKANNPKYLKGTEFRHHQHSSHSIPCRPRIQPHCCFCPDDEKCYFSSKWCDRTYVLRKNSFIASPKFANIMYEHPRSLFSPPFSTPVVLSAHKLRSPCKSKTRSWADICWKLLHMLCMAYIMLRAPCKGIEWHVFFINSFKKWRINYSKTVNRKPKYFYKFFK